MAGGLLRIVGDQHIAGSKRLGRIDGQEVVDAGRHRVDVTGRAGHRLGDHVAARVEDAGREIARLPHDRGEARAHQRGGLLVDHRDQPVPHDFEPDRVHFSILFQRAFAG